MLETEDRNVEFYKRRGFAYMGHNPHGYFDSDEYYFVKHLGPSNEASFFQKTEE